MPASFHSTPLVALDAVVIDTETTGLDASTARLVQIGAIKIHGPDIDKCLRFERLVNPGIPIPPATTGVHGLTDAMVSDAPGFAEIRAELEDFLGRSILIGHSVSYDLAILKRETGLAGAEWRPRRALDVRVLARIAVPTLADHSMERLCEWLRIDLAGRHTAMGDALATARIFAALLPLLRQRNIRTLAEAEAALRAQAEQDARSAGGLIAGDAESGADAVRPLARIDSFPYRHRVRDVMSAPPATLPAEATLREAVKTLIDRGVSSVYVESGPDVVGIATERDVLRALGSHDAGALDHPVGEIMSAPLQSVAADEFVYRAIGRMDRLGLRHLGVHDEEGRVIGAVTTRNLMRLRATSAIMLGDEIDSATDSAALGLAWAKLPLMARQLLEEDVDPRAVAAVISTEIRALTARAAELAELRLASAGKGRPPVRYAVLVLGSAGRGESLLAADQDNAIVFESGEPGSREDKWFEELGGHLADILDEVGVPYCKGGVMAKNALWRKSLTDWKAQVEGWVRRTDPQDLLNVDIFFDAVPVHGDDALGNSLMRHAYSVAHRTPAFVRLLSEPARAWNSPFTLFGGIRTDQTGRIDLKRFGLMPIFTAARVLAIKHGRQARATPDRFSAVLDQGVGSEREISRLVEAHRSILGAMLSQQLIDIEQGIPPSSKVDPKRIAKNGNGALKSALEAVKIAVDLVGEGML